jgi:hypothetical protein
MRNGDDAVKMRGRSLDDANAEENNAEADDEFNALAKVQCRLRGSAGHNFVGGAFQPAYEGFVRARLEIEATVTGKVFGTDL